MWILTDFVWRQWLYVIFLFVPSFAEIYYITCWHITLYKCDDLVCVYITKWSLQWVLLTSVISYRKSKCAWRCACFALWWELRIYSSAALPSYSTVKYCHHAVHYTRSAFCLTAKRFSLLTTFICLCCILGKRSHMTCHLLIFTEQIL